VDPLAQIREWNERLKKMPPPVWRIIARHDVPYGRCFKYYDTKNRLIVYANRGEIADLPHRPAKEQWELVREPYQLPHGIPVVVE
jgi:hypothetical protein